MRTRYHSERKERENIALRHESGQQQVTIDRQQLVSVLGGIVLLLVLASLALLYRTQRSTARHNYQLGEVNQTLEENNARLEQALDQVQTLSGLIPICCQLQKHSRRRKLLGTLGNLFTQTRRRPVYTQYLPQLRARILSRLRRRDQPRHLSKLTPAPARQQSTTANRRRRDNDIIEVALLLYGRTGVPIVLKENGVERVVVIHPHKI